VQLESLEPPCTVKQIEDEGVRDASAALGSLGRHSLLAELRDELTAVIDKLDRIGLLLPAAQVQAALETLDVSQGQK
jgi:hypothetical protein